MEKQSLKKMKYQVSEFGVVPPGGFCEPQTRACPSPRQPTAHQHRRKDKGLKDLLSSHKILWGRQLGTEKERVSVCLWMVSK